MADTDVKDRPPVESTSKVWGDDEAVRAGLYEPRGAPKDGMLPPPAHPTDQALGLDPQVSAYGVAAKKLAQDQLSATQRANADVDARSQRYLQRMEDAYNATGLQKGELPKWDSEKEREKFHTDPIQAFGSLASVFGILASAFTHAPLTNALNASAAAMNAIRQGDEKGYDEAFSAFKENTLLTFKRHELEQQRFSDASRLLETNWKLGEAKMRATAAEFGMHNELAMMDAGLWDQLFQAQQHKMDAAAGMQRSADALTRERFNTDLFKRWGAESEEEFKNDPMKLAAARQRFAMVQNFIRTGSPEWQLIGNELGQWQSQIIHNEHRVPTDSEVTAKVQALKEATTGRPIPLTIDQKVDQESRIAQARQNAKPAGAGPSLSAMHAKTLDDTIKEVRDEHQDWPAGRVEREAEKRVKEANASPVTGNQKLKEEVRIDELGNAMTVVDKIDKTIGKYMLPVGAPGYARRIEERVSNIAGSNRTDLVQLERDITLLKSMAPKLLFGRDGRPLHEDSAKIDKIVAGLSMGDTTANTLRAMKSLREWFVKLQQQNMRRLDESWTPPGNSETPKSDEGSKPWLNAPIRGRAN